MRERGAILVTPAEVADSMGRSVARGVDCAINVDEAARRMSVRLREMAFKVSSDYKGADRENVGAVLDGRGGLVPARIPSGNSMRESLSNHLER